MKAMMRRGLTLALLALAPLAALTPNASASNVNVQYRTFTCDDGHTYTGAFVGLPANFRLVGSSDVFAMKVFTEYLPTGPKTFNYGVNGFDPAQLINCSYTDPAGIFNVFSGFITPADSRPR